MKIVSLIGCLLAILFSSCSRETVKDRDGNSYATVKIGNQVWTAENLRTTKLIDGTPIPHVQDSNAWHGLASPAYCHYRNTTNADSIKKFGALYNWFCVDSKKIAPPGWHVPTNEDWDELKNYLIDHRYNWDRKKGGNRIAKSISAQSDWKPFNIEGTPGNTVKDNNRSGFNGFAAGSRFDTRETPTDPNAAPWKATFVALGHKAAWWSATQVNELQAFAYGLGFCDEYMIQWPIFEKTCGHSVRLVKDRK